MLTVYK